VSPPSSGSKSKPTKTPAEAGGKLNELRVEASGGFLLGLLFDPEDGDDMFFRRVKLFPIYTALRARTPYSSQSPLLEHQIE
jgi:hypothetical protein